MCFLLRLYFIYLFIIHISSNSGSSHDKSEISRLSSVVSKIGGTFCSYFATKSGHLKQKHAFQHCSKPTCEWDSWQHALAIAYNLSTRKYNTSSNKYVNTSRTFNTSAIHTAVYRRRVVLSLAHNGFGNQLWEHTFAFMIAESLKAKLLISPIPMTLLPQYMYNKGTPGLPPNTLDG